MGLRMKRLAGFQFLVAALLKVSNLPGRDAVSLSQQSAKQHGVRRRWTLNDKTNIFRLD